MIKNEKSHKYPEKVFLVKKNSIYPKIYKDKFF